MCSGSGHPNPIPLVIRDVSPAPLPSSYAAYDTTDEYPNWLCAWRVDYVFIRHLYLYFVQPGFNLSLIPILMCGWESNVFCCLNSSDESPCMVRGNKSALNLSKWGLFPSWILLLSTHVTFWNVANTKSHLSSLSFNYVSIKKKLGETKLEYSPE